MQWLEQTKPTETEDRVFRLWGLKYAGASDKSLAAAALDLLRTQRPDGGWSQLDAPAEPAKTKDAEGKANHRAPSDAYATGSALVALHLAGGVSTDDPAYRRGLDFLLRTQRTDGTWFIKSRSRPFQTYFESGFPHGPDQFISAAGSGWATAALVLACPVPDPVGTCSAEGGTSGLRNLDFRAAGPRDRRRICRCNATAPISQPEYQPATRLGNRGGQRWVDDLGFEVQAGLRGRGLRALEMKEVLNVVDRVLGELANGKCPAQELGELVAQRYSLSRPASLPSRCGRRRRGTAGRCR